MHCDMLKIQDGGAIVEKVNFISSAFWSTMQCYLPFGGSLHRAVPITNR